MTGRKKKGGTPIIGWLIVVATLAGIGTWLYLHQGRLKEYMSPPAAQPSLPAAAGDKSGEVVHMKGKLQVPTPVRDTELGVSADAVLLARSVEMYQWFEQCGEDNVCRYSLTWSRMPMDSSKFHEPKGHENPPAPLKSMSFQASEIKLGEFTVDPALAVAQRIPVDYPVKADALAQNLAATFTVVDGMLYAGGDPAHPQAGTLRIRYRIVPAGEVEITGIKHGSRIEAK